MISYRSESLSDRVADVFIAAGLTTLGVLGTGVTFLQSFLIGLPPGDGAIESGRLVIHDSFGLMIMASLAIPTIVIIWPLYAIASWGRKLWWSFLTVFGPSALIAGALGWCADIMALIGLYMAVPVGLVACYLLVPRLPRRGQFCPRCDYDLRDLSDTGCPECGWNRAAASGP